MVASLLRSLAGVYTVEPGRGKPLADAVKRATAETRVETSILTVCGGQDIEVEELRKYPSIWAVVES
jgi:hypothetical protein